MVHRVSLVRHEHSPRRKGAEGVTGTANLDESTDHVRELKWDRSLGAVCARVAGRLRLPSDKANPVYGMSARPVRPMPIEVKVSVEFLFPDYSRPTTLIETSAG
jgi:hypothetical protein